MNNKLRSYVSQNSDSLNAMIKGSSMNRKQRYGTLAAVTFTAALVATLALVPLADQQAFARPQPTGPAVGDHVMKKIGRAHV